MSASYIQRPDTAFSVDRQRRPREKKPAYLAWLRTLPCAVCGSYKGIEAAHYRSGDPRYSKPSTGMGERPHDRWALPLCGDHHREQHSMNEVDFWKRYGIDAALLASALWGEQGNEEAALKIIGESRP
jgi:hypothetical protein